MEMADVQCEADGVWETMFEDRENPRNMETSCVFNGNREPDGIQMVQTVQEGFSIGIVWFQHFHRGRAVGGSQKGVSANVEADSDRSQVLCKLSQVLECVKGPLDLFTERQEKCKGFWRMEGDMKTCVRKELTQNPSLGLREVGRMESWDSGMEFQNRTSEVLKIFEDFFKGWRFCRNLDTEGE